MRGPLGLAAFAVMAGCQGQGAQDAASLEEPAPAASSPAATDLAASAAEPGAIRSVACAAGEEPIFACKLDGGKRLAVCGTGPGKAEYRFGGDQAEIVLRGGERAGVMYSGGGEQQLAFANGDTRYIVFSRMVRTRFDGNGNEPAISDGVVVERGGQFVAIRICNDPDVLPVSTGAAERFLSIDPATSGETLFTEETIRADPFGNE